MEKEPNYEQKWNELEERLYVLKKAIYEQVFPAPKPFTDWYLEKLTEYLDKIKETYPDDEERKKFLSYHSSIGSSALIEKSPELDFPGELSFELFCENILAELKSKAITPQD
jgi:hypothetical protein